jgi:hypothetical protein
MKTLIKLIPYLLTVLATSAIWFLALNDGTVEVIKHHYANNRKMQALYSVEEKLQIEVTILELEIKKRAYIAQIHYMDSQGF